MLIFWEGNMVMLFFSPSCVCIATRTEPLYTLYNPLPYSPPPPPPPPPPPLPPLLGSPGSVVGVSTKLNTQMHTCITQSILCTLLYGSIPMYVRHSAYRSVRIKHPPRIKRTPPLHAKLLHRVQKQCSKGPPITQVLSSIS